MMKKIFLLTLLFLGQWVNAQETSYSEDEQAVYEVILQLFDGMRSGDSSAVRSVFHPDASMFTSSENKEGELIVTEGNLSGFLNAIGSPHDEIWDEKIWNTSIKVEMGVAQVWTDYAFYVGDQFSHCGIDAFQLFEQNGWKIIQIIDTRKKMNCEKPK